MEKICRTCLSSLNNKKSISIYDNFADDMKIYLKIIDFSGIVIPENEENLPNCICMECCEKLTNSFHFRNLCRSSDNELKNNLFLIKHEPVLLADHFNSDSENGFNYSPNFASVPDFNSESEKAVKYSPKVEIEEHDEEKNVEKKKNSKSKNEEKVTNIKKLEKEENDSPYNLKAIFSAIPGFKRKHICKICKKKICGGRYHQLRHLQNEKHQSQLSLIKELENGNIEISEPIPKKKPTYICEICGKFFDQKYKFRNHNLLHGEKSYFCEICNKTFRQKLQVKRHMRVHTGEKPYKCTFCEKCFAHFGTKKQHERTHTNERPFECTVCEKRFRQKVVRDAHMRIHTGEKPYSCEICNLFFIKKYHIDRHLKSKSHNKLLKEKQ